MLLSKVISGGQTGADRAGLDWAIENGIPHGGFCPKGRRCEDGQIPTKYLLTEAGQNYGVRTERNVRESDGTVIFVGVESTGSALTRNLAQRYRKPCITVKCELYHFSPRQTAQALRKFVEENKIKVLNVAGNRASVFPGAYEVTKECLDLAFKNT